jgi:hypothetical protein
MDAIKLKIELFLGELGFKMTWSSKVDHISHPSFE